METHLTIGIPTCARPQAIKGCLDSLQKHLTVNHQIIVIDSAINDENLTLYKSIPHLKYLTFDSPIGPSEARKLIIEKTETKYLLFLDDDNEVTPGTVESMLSYIEKNPHIDILGSVWREYGDFEKRAVGQYFKFGQLNGKKTIYKDFLDFKKSQELELDSIKVDAVLATMLIQTKIFEQVQFDSRFDFFFELFDFFMQCYQHKKNIHVLPTAIFEHKPLTYSSSTLRQKTHADIDKQKFIDKWELQIIGSHGFKSSKKSKEVSSSRFKFKNLLSRK